MTSKKNCNFKNVIVFNTDQQRADSLGCMGNVLARTPNIDRLADQGNLYTRHYAANPVCMPSRASFITGRHLQAHRVLDNGIFLSEKELTMPEVFRRNGYRTFSVGKLHLQPVGETYDSDDDVSKENVKRWKRGELDDWHGPYYGFEEVKLAIGHGEAGLGHYGKWREEKFPDMKIGVDNAQGEEKYPECRSYKSNMPLEAHHSTWVADNAIEFLENHNTEDKPFYLNVSFPDPHVPFTPPTPYNTMFDDIEFPPPHRREGENETKPECYRRSMRNPNSKVPPVFNPELHGRAYQQMMSHTYGMVTLIDDCVGRVMETVKKQDLQHNTVIVFTSDHGDYLGDHYFFCKSPAPSRSLLHIPLIISDPDTAPGTVEEVCGNVDVMPALLNVCGIDIPDTVQGVILPEPGEKAKRDYAYASAWSKYSPFLQHFTIYKKDWRISIFPHLEDGELYDLKTDPYELCNLYHNSDYRGIRDELLRELLFAAGKAEPRKPPNDAPY